MSLSDWCAARPCNSIVRFYATTRHAKTDPNDKPTGNNGLSSLDRTHYTQAIPYTTHVQCNDFIIISVLNLYNIIRFQRYPFNGRGACVLTIYNII